MTAPSATVEVWVDGTRVASTPGELAGGRVTVLDGLKVTWGRDGANEQPGPAACQLALADPAGRDEILDVLHVGSAVDVWAEGVVPVSGDDTYIQTFDDGTFDSWPLGVPPPGSTNSLDDYAFTTTVTAVSGRGHVLRMDRKAARDDWPTTIPPRAFSPAGTLPDAWDTIPRYSRADGAAWRVQLSFRATAGLRVSWGVNAYTDPYTTATAGTWGLAAVYATGEWQTVSGLFSGAVDGVWLGAYLRVTGVNAVPETWAEQTGTWAEQTGTWAQRTPPPYIEIDDILIGPPVGSGTTRRVLVFSGSVSDVVVSPWGNQVSTAVDVTAMDIGAQLGNTVVGDTPWPVQTVATRANRIAQLAGITTTPRIRIDTPLDALQVSARDVDAQPAQQLLSDLAQSAGGVLWAATHAVTGAYLWIENPAGRAAVRELTFTGGQIVITGSTDDVLLISACDLLEDSVAWRQSTEDVSTVVAVTWLEQGPPDDDGLPTTTERTVTVKDQASIDGTGGKPKLGTRRLSVSTELISESDATAYANRMLAQARAVGWRLDGLTWDTGVNLPDQLPTLDDGARQTAFLDLLDGTIRMGAAVVLVDMPDYAPRGSVSAVYVEGGTYTYSGDAWRLELATSPSAAAGKGATWAQLDPAWSWQQWDPGISWQELYGVAP